MATANNIRRFVPLISLIGILVSQVTFSQSSPYKNYSVKDGLPSSEAYYVMQDSKGFMWFCTSHGVCKFDGYEFKTYNSANGLASNTIFNCQEDYKGRIWFTSLSGKLSYYFHDSIFSLPINDTISSILKTSFITGLSVDTNDNLYLGSSGTGGIIYIDLKKKHSIRLITLPKKTYYIGLSSSGPAIFGNTIPNSGKWEMPEDTVGISLLSLSSNNYKLSKTLNWKRQVFYLVDKNDMAISLPGNKTATCLYSAFIISDTGKILFSHIFNSAILKLCKGKNDDIWIIPKDQVPVIYRNGKIITLPNLGFLKNQHITSATIDKEGGLWFTSLQSGVLYLPFPNMETWTKENGLANDKTTGLFVAPDSSLWAVQENSRSITIIKHDSIMNLTIPESWPESSVSSVLFNSNGTKWISTAEGIYIFDRQNKVIARPEKFIVSVTRMLKKNENIVWANAYSSLCNMERIGDSVIHTYSIPLKSKIFSVCKDSSGNLWLGTHNGLFQYIHDSLVFYGSKNPLLKDIITDIKYSDGQFWMTTGDRGVIFMRNDTVIQLTDKNGLPTNFCQCIYIDYKGNIWIGTNEGLSLITLRNSTTKLPEINIKNITSFNLIEVNYITGLGNKLFVGTNNGIIAFNTSVEMTNTVAPPVFITELKVNDKIISPPTGTVNLAYDENYIILNYTGLTYRDAGNVLYRYKMIGIDTGWHYTKTTNVQYPKLAPGNYRFLVSAMNNDGVWNETPASVSFRITPPFWNTWWARTLLIMALVLFIYWRIKLIENREKKKTEINKHLATMELRELEKQLDPHFLFNNLGALKYLIDESTNDAQHFVDELSQFYRYNLMRRNKGFTELENETAQAKRYLGLLKIRFGEQIQVKWDVNEKLSGYYIPPFSLQLLLENITKHNILSSEMRLLVEIRTTGTNTLVVKNQLRRKKTNIVSTGHGLKNINEHYKLETGKEITINESSEYFSIELPLIPPDQYEGINH